MYSYTTRAPHGAFNDPASSKLTKHMSLAHLTALFLVFFSTLKKKQNNHSMKPTPPKQTTLLHQSVRLTNKTKTPNCFI